MAKKERKADRSGSGLVEVAIDAEKLCFFHKGLLRFYCQHAKYQHTNLFLSIGFRLANFERNMNNSSVFLESCEHFVKVDPHLLTFVFPAVMMKSQSKS